MIGTKKPRASYLPVIISTDPSPTKDKQMANPFTNIVVQTKPLESAADRVRVARYMARSVVGYFAPPLMALRMYESKSVPTLSVTQTFQMYYNPEFVDKMVDQAKAITPSAPCPTCGATSHHELAYVGGVLLHEAMHPFKRHSKRARAVGADREFHHVWNIAADLEINDMLLQVFDLEHKHRPNFPKLCIPEGCVRLEQYKFAPDIAAEVYFKDLMALPQPPQSSPNCGSGADGHSREYEDSPDGGGSPSDQDNPQDTAGDPYGSSEEDVKDMERRVAKGAREASARRGTVPAGLVVWSDGVLAPPKYNWRSELSKMVRYGEALNTGDGEDSFHRIHKMSAALDFEVIFPSELEYTARNIAVIDTSGSMLSGGGRSLLDEAISEVDNIRELSNGEIMVIDCDAEVYSTTPKKVTNLKKMNLRGGGGTDMRVGLAVAEKVPRVDYTLLFTDGYTPFPDKPLRNGSLLIVVLIGASKENASRFGIPSWAKTVFVTQ